MFTYKGRIYKYIRLGILGKFFFLSDTYSLMMSSLFLRFTVFETSVLVYQE